MVSMSKRLFSSLEQLFRPQFRSRGFDQRFRWCRCMQLHTLLRTPNKEVLKLHLNYRGGAMNVSIVGVAAILSKSPLST